MRRTQRLLSLTLAVVLALVFLPTATGVSTASAQQDVNIRDILDDSPDLVGEDVNFDATVVDRIGRTGLIVEDAEGDSVIVVGNPGDLPGADEIDGPIGVTGTVEVLDDIAEINEQYGLRLPAEQYDRYLGEIVVISERINVEPEETEPLERVVGLEELLDNPEALVGLTVTVTAQVTDLLNPQAFTMERRADFAADTEGGAGDDEFGDVLMEDTFDEILVLYDTDSGELPPRISEEAIVRVTGEMQFLEQEVIDEFFEEPDVAEYEDNQPVILARDVSLVVPAKGALIERILDDAEPFMGERVTVLGDVDDILLPRAFSLDGTSGFLGLSERNLLVIGGTEIMPRSLTEDALVQVTGVVREFHPDDPFTLGPDYDEEQLGPLFTDEQFSPLEDFDDEPVIVATSVDVLKTDAGQTVEELLEDIDPYVGQRVTVAGNIFEILDPQAFSLQGETGIFGLKSDSILVVGTEDVMPRRLTIDTIVVVNGIVREFDADDPFVLAQDLDEEGSEFLFRDATFEAFDGEPIIIADSIVAVAVD